MAGPHWVGRPRPSSTEDSTGGAMLSAMEATRTVEDRRRIVITVVSEVSKCVQEVLEREGYSSKSR